MLSDLRRHIQRAYIEEFLLDRERDRKAEARQAAADERDAKLEEYDFERDSGAAA